MIHREDVLTEVLGELFRQDNIHGSLADGNNPSWDDRFIRLGIAVEEIGEVGRALLENDAFHAREEWVQVAAVAVSNIERIDFANYGTLPMDEVKAR